MQVAILGPLEVNDDRGVAIEVSGSRLRAVLVRLALAAGRPVSPAALAATVWGEQLPADTANALQTLVSRLRKSLGTAAVVDQSPAGYRLAIGADDVDANRFEALAADGSQTLRAGDPVRAADQLRQALALWRGNALSDVGEVFHGQAARLDELRLACLVDRLAADIELGEAAGVVAELEALAGRFPLDERIAGQLVTALAGAGRQADALGAYERTRARLADELGIDPSVDLQAVHLAVLRGEVTTADAASPVRRTNLKAQLTSFVGRDDDVAGLVTSLQHNRLVTLVGPGGAGKTRLAIEAATTLTAVDGVWLAELAPVTDGADVAQAVLGALGLREKHLLDRHPTRAGQDAEGRLVDVLVDKVVVLVLDNCEHLIDASAHLAGHLLEQCPGLRVLATSREPLGIIGEVVRAVPPLGQPAADAAPVVALDYPAVRLFADRAAAVRPGFVVDDASVATVIDIVRRLDGLPLAIELAAARLRSTPVSEIASRLTDRFRLLTGGSRTALPRHRTLRAVVEWSWDLLTEPERLLVERLAIFPAGVIVESAAAVGVDEVVHVDDIADLLASLIDKSLLQRVGDGPRLRMLETIREYGIERLDERRELFDVRSRHADYFAALLEQAQPHLISAGQLPWFERLTDERENLLAAFRFRCESGAADGALQIAVAMASFALMIGNHGEISSWAADALAVPGARDEDLLWTARALDAVYSTMARTAHDTADERTKQLQIAAQHLADVTMQRYPLIANLRPVVAFLAGETELAHRMLTESLSSGDAWSRAAARMLRASLAENEGNVELMRADVDIALAEFRRLGERWGLANTLRSKALVDQMAGDLAGAEAAYLEALELMRQLKSREDEAFLLIRMADIAARRGDQTKSQALMARAAESAEQVGSPVESVVTVSMLAESERQSGNLDRARALHGEAMQRITSLPTSHPAYGHGWTIVLALSARLAFADGDRTRALELGHDAFVAAAATNDLPLTASVGVMLAEFAAGGRMFEVAAEMLGASARLRGAEDTTAIDVTNLRSMLMAALGAAEFSRHYDQGRSLGRADALQRLDASEALAEMSAQTRRP